MKSKDAYLVPTILDTFEDINSWWDIDIDEAEKKKKKKKKRKRKKKTAKKRKKAIIKKKAAKKAKKKKQQKKLKKQQKRTEKQCAQEFRYQLIIKATETACDITKMYFYNKFGSPT